MDILDKINEKLESKVIEEGNKEVENVVKLLADFIKKNRKGKDIQIASTVNKSKLIVNFNIFGLTKKK